MRLYNERGEAMGTFGADIGKLCVISKTMINYNNKTFIPISNSENGETSNKTVFHYEQVGDIVTSEYSGGQIIKGHLIGLVDEKGNIDMRYHQINKKGNFRQVNAYLNLKYLRMVKSDFTRIGNGLQVTNQKANQ